MGTGTTEAITISRAEYEDLRNQNKRLLEQLRLTNKKRLGASGEMVQEELMGRLSLAVNEAEAYAAAPPGVKTAIVAAHRGRSVLPGWRRFCRRMCQWSM